MSRAAAGKPIAIDVAERVVRLDGGRNFRDLGGYPTIDGRQVIWRKLYRSGSLSSLTPAGLKQLRALGIKAVCDLRTDKERNREPIPALIRDSSTYWAGDYRASFADLRTTMKQGHPSAEEARAGMIAGYRDLPFEQGPSFRQIFAFLQNGQVPLVVNCVAGKDRTGMAAALLLTALGVTRDSVIADYVLTNKVYDVELNLLRTKEAEGSAPDGVRSAIARADPAYLESALDAVDVRHGGIEGYLHNVVGIDATALRALRDRLLTND